MAKRRLGDDLLDWNPQTFEDAKAHVDMARELGPPIGPDLAHTMVSAIGLIGHLRCPSPPNDPSGTYGVGLDDSGQPEIQRRDMTSGWITA